MTVCNLPHLLYILDNMFYTQDPTVICTHGTIFIPKYNRKLGKTVVRGGKKLRDSERWDNMLKDEERWIEIHMPTKTVDCNVEQKGKGYQP